MLDTLVQRLETLIRPDRATQIAKEQGWQKRQGKIMPFEFLHSSLGQASALDLTLSAQASTLTLPVTRQAVDQRYTPEAIKFFKAAFQESLARTLKWKVDSPMSQALQQCFRTVRLFDSTHCPCSDALASIFPASGGGGSTAGFKVLLSYDFGAAQWQPLQVLPANNSDQGLATQACQEIGPEELGIFDKGFYHALSFRQVQARGGYFLVPWHQGVTVRTSDAQGQPGDLLPIATHLKASTERRVEWSAVHLGKTQDSHLGPVRLIAFRLSEQSAHRRRAQLREKCRTHGRQPTVHALELAGWLILVTNAPAQLLPSPAAAFLYRARWQIELVFKQWKGVLRLDVLPSDNDCRVQCEVWARLLTALLVFVWYQHANAACLQLHQREISFSKLAKLVQQHGRVLVRVLFGYREQIQGEFRSLWNHILKLARKERQPSRPTTWENLCTHWLELPAI